MDDLIYRDDAINAHCMCSCGKERDEYCKCDDPLWFDVLPSAQPEIIHCGDCKHYVDVRNRLTVKGSQGKCESLGFYTHSEWYCGNAERRGD